MDEITILKFLITGIGIVVGLGIRTIWRLPKEYVLKEDFINAMNRIESKIDGLSVDIKQLMKDRK